MKSIVIPSDKVILKHGREGFFLDDEIEFCANTDGIEKDVPFADPDGKYKRIYVCAIVEDEAEQLLVSHMGGGYYAFEIETILHAGESMTEALLNALQEHCFNPDDIRALSKGGYFVDHSSVNVLYTVSIAGHWHGPSWWKISDVYDLNAKGKLADWSSAALRNLL